MAVRIFGNPISRYSYRVLKTAPSQCVCGMSQKVGRLVEISTGADEAGEYEMAAAAAAIAKRWKRIRILHWIPIPVRQAREQRSEVGGQMSERPEETAQMPDLRPLNSVTSDFW